MRSNEELLNINVDRDPCKTVGRSWLFSVPNRVYLRVSKYDETRIEFELGSLICLSKPIYIVPSVHHTSKFTKRFIIEVMYLQVSESNNPSLLFLISIIPPAHHTFKHATPDMPKLLPILLVTRFDVI